MKAAIIDIGSNSVRYAVLDQDTELAEKELSGTVLADGLFFSGKLSDAAITRTVDAVAAFCDKAQTCGIRRIHIFATEAVRAASNGKDFTDAVFARTGIAVDVLSGAQEAHIGFTGAVPECNSPVAVFDMGGASCEVICGAGGRIVYEKSMPIGCVRLRDGAQQCRTRAEQLIAAALPASLPDAASLIGIGGTATALGAMLSCPDRYDRYKTHNSRVPFDFVCDIADEFFDGADMSSRYPCLTPNRARIIGYGALAAIHLLRVFSLPAFTVSERDNIEGYYLSLPRE